ncbi:MAG: Gfo/Idh/MocA family oxidoreductase, partial [Planctomycetales bacterium]
MSADSHNLPAQGLKILIIGFGSIGRRHYHNFKNLGCSNFVFCRTGRGTIDDAETSDYPRAASVQEALSHRPDVAVVATPTALHVEAALAAARAGCDLLIEKPLSHSMQGCEELLDAVRVSNRVA